jgi:methylene-tetrahydromethanopterin dehydrogenase
MERPAILHMISPDKHVSPFDVNMAADAGFDVIQTYGGVAPAEVAGLVQDMIFSRSPKDARRTALFIAGKDAGSALDMLKSAKAAMVPPFAISVFADPSGSFTTAAACVSLIERHLRDAGGLAGRPVTVFGATGIVGAAAAVLAAKAGGKVTLVSHRGGEAAARRTAELEQRFAVKITPAGGADAAAKTAAAAGAEIVITAGPPALQILSRAELDQAQALKVLADVNAVPPAGVEGLGAADAGKPLAGTKAVGFGPLAIGNVKFKTQHRLLRMMLEAEQPLLLDFEEAYRVARAIVG